MEIDENTHVEIDINDIQQLINFELIEEKNAWLWTLSHKYNIPQTKILFYIRNIVGSDEEYYKIIGFKNKKDDNPFPTIQEKEKEIKEQTNINQNINIKENNNSFNPVEFYKKYAEQITCAYKENIYIDSTGQERCNARRSQERDKYLFHGLTDNHVLIECPKDILAIEFEIHNNKSKDERKEVPKEKIKEWIKLTKEKCNELKIDYCICDHSGTSPWVYICNITGLIEKNENACKKELAKKIIPDESFDFVDQSNFGNTLIPIIEMPHWKIKKYNGRVHKIIDGINPDKHNNKIPQDVLDEVMFENKPSNIHNYNSFDSESDINSLSITSIINLTGLKRRGHEYQGANPWHGSTSGTNFTVDPQKNVFYCFRCGVGGNVAQAIGLNEGIIGSCSDKMSKEQFKKTLEIAYTKHGLKKPDSEFFNYSDDINDGIILPCQRGSFEIEDIRQQIANINLSSLPKEIKKDRITELIARNIESSYYIYSLKEDVNSEMWIYNDGIYVPNAKSEIKRMVRLILGTNYNMTICQNIINKIEADRFIEHPTFFGTNYIDLIPVRNGILNLKTRELTPFTPEKIFFNKLPINYNTAAKCPAIEKHFEEVLKSKDDADVIYELIGFCLYKDYFIEKAVMMVGFGRNGKSKTIDLIKRFIGIENCSSVPLISFNEENFSLSNLFGKMVNMAGDLSPTSLKETGIFKRTTGRDLISAKRKFLTDINFTNYAKHLFACNELPRVYDTSKGFWERWLIFEFPYTFVPPSEYELLTDDEKFLGGKKLMDSDHISKITTQDELDGLLIKALDGLDRIRKLKEFSNSVGSDNIKQFWIRKADSFMAFCLDNIIEDYNGYITKKDLRNKYLEYKKKHGLKGTSEKSIKITLQENYGAEEEWKSIFNLSVPVWEGISFKK